MRPKIPKRLAAKLTKVRLFLCDVDGVLTDGTVGIGLAQETKTFHIQDGLGMVLLKKEGIRVGWVSNRPSSATTMRAEELKIDFLCQLKGGKVAAVQTLLNEAGCDWDEICYMGDDVVDLGVLRKAGVAVAVANAIPEAKAEADYVTKLAGGNGAVRETIELILRAQGRWDRIVEGYLNLQ
ncbi:MAG TPA: HAD hydrolase family protein [Roseimicrobium sp.]|nr:HAD hydrolase family protein [Roseimicrobium sp.]